MNTKVFFCVIFLMGGCGMISSLTSDGNSFVSQKSYDENIAGNVSVSLTFDGNKQDCGTCPIPECPITCCGYPSCCAIAEHLEQCWCCY